ncbi:MAG: glutamate-5-semialdehyde dehydrogenase [Defluviitaleaceae bacterium]|nr:glutamate-5-semialdehyde dehydrogenase [Defluviitaleaceae bacterium]
MFDLEKMGQSAKAMAKYVSRLPGPDKNAALLACADAIEARAAYILEQNQQDMASADPARSAFNDRLALNPKRVASMAEGLRKVAKLEDPIGETLYMKTLPNGLQIGERRAPLGVIGIIYEARPNVTADSFGLCFKAGNSSILRGGSEAIHSNTAIVSVLQDALEAAGHPRQVVQLITDTSREVARALMGLRQYVDVLIPRGGSDLIGSVVQNSTIPVIETGVGNCHIFVDESADLAKAVSIVLNAKTQRPSVCNACEKLLVHRAIAETFLPEVCTALAEHGVAIRGDNETLTAHPAATAATAEDWHTEFLDLVIGIKVVDNLEEAIDHISLHSTGHSEAILTLSYTNAQRFTAEVDSAAVYVNASTRFTDGEEFGLGAEIGISTQKLHARGPMGLKALTTTKFVILGDGQIRA